MPASGHQNATTSPSARVITRQLTTPRPSHPAPTLLTIREAPLLWARDGRNRARDLPVVTRQNACGRLTRRANHLACAKSCQVKKPLLADVPLLIPVVAFRRLEKPKGRMPT